MTSYFASLTSSSAISNLGTRLNSLRRAISSGDEADDTENEDCSHISNVLRAYYTEKGRAFPPWLPPDPKAPAPPPPRVIATQATLQQGGYGQAPAMSAGGRGAGLSDLWGDSGSSQPPPAQQTLSLRRGRAQPQAAVNSLSATQSPSISRPSTANSLRPPASSQTPPPPSGARPLPSQRAGSYQTTQSAQQSRLGLGRTDSGGSAQERLRARLHGGGSFGGSSPSPPPAQSPGGSQPYMGSSRPWQSGDPAGFDGGYGSSAGGGGVPRKPVGLPSGPRLRGPR